MKKGLKDRKTKHLMFDNNFRDTRHNLNRERGRWQQSQMGTNKLLKNNLGIDKHNP